MLVRSAYQKWQNGTEWASTYAYLYMIYGTYTHSKWWQNWIKLNALKCASKRIPNGHRLKQMLYKCQHFIVVFIVVMHSRIHYMDECTMYQQLHTLNYILFEIVIKQSTELNYVGSSSYIFNGLLLRLHWTPSVSPLTIQLATGIHTYSDHFRFSLNLGTIFNSI